MRQIKYFRLSLAGECAVTVAIKRGDDRLNVSYGGTEIGSVTRKEVKETGAAGYRITAPDGAKIGLSVRWNGSLAVTLDGEPLGTMRWFRLAAACCAFAGVSAVSVAVAALAGQLDFSTDPISSMALPALFALLPLPLLLPTLDIGIQILSYGIVWLILVVLLLRMRGPGRLRAGQFAFVWFWLSVVALLSNLPPGAMPNYLTELMSYDVASDIVWFALVFHILVAALWIHIYKDMRAVARKRMVIATSEAVGKPATLEADDSTKTPKTQSRRNWMLDFVPAASVIVMLVLLAMYNRINAGPYGGLRRSLSVGNWQEVYVAVPEIAFNSIGSLALSDPSARFARIPSGLIGDTRSSAAAQLVFALARAKRIEAAKRLLPEVTNERDRSWAVKAVAGALIRSGRYADGWQTLLSVPRFDPPEPRALKFVSLLRGWLIGPYGSRDEGLRIRELDEAQAIAPQLENRYEALYTVDQARNARYDSADRQAEIINGFEARITSDHRRYEAALRLLILTASKDGQLEQIRKLLGVPIQDNDIAQTKLSVNPQTLEREKRDLARTAKLEAAVRAAREQNPVLARQDQEQAQEQALSQLLSTSVKEGRVQQFRQSLDQLPPDRRLAILSDIVQRGSETVKAHILDYLPTPLPTTQQSSIAFEAYINFADAALTGNNAKRAGEFLLVAREKADGEYGITDKFGIKDLKARDLCKSGQLATVAIRFARMGDVRQAENVAMSTTIPLHRMAVDAAVLLEELKRADQGLAAALQPGGEEATLLDTLSPFPVPYKLCGLR